MTKSYEDVALEGIADAIYSLRKSITPIAMPGTDAVGGSVDSLTEAVMGITGGLCKVADAIDRLASAVEDIAEHGKP